MMIRAFIPTKFACLAVGGLLVASLLSSTARAQSPTSVSQPTSTLVALVDLQEVFDSHLSFKAKREELQEQLRAADRDLAAKRKQIDERSLELRELNPSSSDYMKREKQLAQQMADLQVQAHQTKKQFMQREALHYFAAYNEIVSAVSQVADQYGIALVLRFDSAAIDPSQPSAVAHGMSRTVVVQRNLDITQPVVNALQVILASRSDQQNTPRR